MRLGFIVVVTALAAVHASGAADTSERELISPEKIVARVTAGSALSFNDARHISVSNGAVLLQTPRAVRGARLIDGEIAVVTSGTTIVFEHHDTTYKLIVLEGTARLYRPNHLGDSVLVEAGQIAFGQRNTELSDPADFDLEHFTKTCRLLTDFGPLPNAAAIAREGEKQALLKNKKQLLATNAVIFGRGNSVTLTDSGKIDNATTETSAAPNPKPTRAMDSLSAVDAARAAGTSR